MSRSLLCCNPLVLVVDDMFSAETAALAISQGEGKMEAHGVLTDYGLVFDERKTSTVARVDQWEFEPLTALATEISSIVRLPPENAERAKLIRYEAGQKFDVHQDAFADNEASREARRAGGQTLFTSICYLNEPLKGGQTIFPELKLSVRPKIGRVLVFSNTYPGTDAPHPHASHAGLPPEDGEKWILTLFWREAAWHQPRDYPSADGDYQQV